MIWTDSLRIGLGSLAGYRTRTWLILLAMTIGVGSVVTLTALGEGARLYVVNEFRQLGTHLLVVLPGRSETTGGAPPLLGETPRDLTLDDALSLTRLRSVKRIAPITVGSAPVSHGSLEREVTILGSTPELYPIRHLSLAQGRFLPEIDPKRGAAVVVLGQKLKTELFGNKRALGEWVRINDRRFRVVGILAPLGQSLGADISDIAIIPVASAQALFNTASLFRVLVQARGRETIDKAEKEVRDTIRERHDGEDDVTIITQDAVLSTFDGIFRALTYTVAGIAAVSLAVAGILIMNVMLVAVSQRTPEIGLLKAVGASQGQIQRLFLLEATMLALGGGAIGLALSYGVVRLFDYLFPAFPLAVPLWSPIAALLVALGNGVLFGILPARRAARMDPVLALSRR